MRAILVIGILTHALGFANPIFVGPPPLAAYLDSERLLVSMSATEAVFTGSFTFATRELLRPPSDKDPWRGERSMSVEVYIWFPEQSDGDPTVEEFWRTFRKSNFNFFTSAAATETFDRILGLKIRIGDRELKAGRGIDSFLAVPYRPPDPETDRFMSNLLKAAHIPQVPAPKLDEPGFCLLLLYFHDDGTLVRNRTQMTISYRQPLLRSTGGACFFYMPVFDNVPDGFSPNDTNRYSITFTAQGCSVTITNGTKIGIVDNHCSATFPPQLCQPFRAVSRVSLKPQAY
jgi:hypothetical protein